MAPPNNESKPTPKLAATTTAAAGKAGPAASSAPCLLSLKDGDLTVGGGDAKAKAALLTGVPGNVTPKPKPRRRGSSSSRPRRTRGGARSWASRRRRRRRPTARRAEWVGFRGGGIS
ncbi:unnamed protein product [Urochloa humidicola]